MESNNESPPRQLGQRLLHRNLAVALAISAAGTAALGGVLFMLGQSVWWLAVGGLLSLFASGAWSGWNAKEPEPLYGALLAVLYFGLVAGALFGGELAEALPDPLPGLAIGDSTFFFVSPLLMLAASVGGSVVGGGIGLRRRVQMQPGSDGVTTKTRPHGTHG